MTHNTILYAYLSIVPYPSIDLTLGHLNILNTTSGHIY